MKRATLVLTLLTALDLIGSVQGGMRWQNPPGVLDNRLQFTSGFGNSDSASLPSPPFTQSPGLQYNNTLFDATGIDSSTAAAGFGYYDNSNSAIITAAYGTGVTQSAPFGAQSPAVLSTETFLDFFGLGSVSNWNAFYSFPISASVSLGGFDELLVDVTVHEYFEAPATSTIVDDSVHFRDDYKFSQPGLVQKVVSNSAPLDPIPPGSVGNLYVSMDFTFTALDPDGPASITSLGGGFGTNPSTSAVPEPASLTLLGLGALCLGGCAWRRRKAACPAG